MVDENDNTLRTLKRYVTLIIAKVCQNSGKGRQRDDSACMRWDWVNQK